MKEVYLSPAENRRSSTRRKLVGVAAGSIMLFGLTGCDAGDDTKEAWNDTKATTDDAWEQVKDWFTTDGNRKHVIGIDCGEDANKFTVRAPFDAEKKTLNIVALCLQDGKSIKPNAIRQLEGGDFTVRDDQTFSHTITTELDGDDMEAYLRIVGKEARVTVRNVDEVESDVVTAPNNS